MDIYVVAGAAVIAAIVATYFAFSLRAKLRIARSELVPFSKIVDLEAHAATVKEAAEAASKRVGELEQEISARQMKIAKLKQERTEVEEAIDIQSFGLYRAQYSFADPQGYKDELDRVRDRQKNQIKNKKAATCGVEWSVEGDKNKGRRMTEQQIKLMLRAFNGECDAAVAKVTYSNIASMESRIQKSFEAVNKLGEPHKTAITREYLLLKLNELSLVHEHQEKLQDEKEEQRRIKEEMQEEQKAQRELDKARIEAEKEEAMRERALKQAREELAKASGTQHAKFEALVARLENELKDALDRKAKAIARAQLTRSGHVYVLSNIGSFGQGVYKIGMTRRLEPLERVKELGAASVPFPFDVHAMIYTEDAPGLENALHHAFESRRVNMVNLRREYFRVSLDEIRREVGKLHGIVTFVLDPPAEEYFKSQAMARGTGDILSKSASPSGDRLEPSAQPHASALPTAGSAAAVWLSPRPEA